MSGAGVGGFGDARLGRVGALLLERVQERQTLCLHALADARTETLRFGRFLDSDAVSAEEMLVQAGRQTARRAAGRHILAIQDTTELHFAGHAASKHGFGRAGNGEDIGLFLHPTIAVDAAHGGVVGLVGATVLNRTAGKVAPRRQRTAEARESHRWLAGARSAEAVLEQAAMITVVADRESDIYDLFARRPARVHLLSRAAQDRGLAEGGRLFAHAAALPGQAHHVIAVPGRGARPARQAVVALRFGAVTLLRPATAARDLAERVVVHLVDVAEATPPPGEPALHWCLLTTHAVADVAAAQQVVGWYQARWTIDIDQAWRLSRIKWWMGSTCHEAFWVEHRGSSFSPVQIRAADRRKIAGQRGRAIPAWRRGARRAHCQQDCRAGFRATADIGRGSP